MYVLIITRDTRDTISKRKDLNLNSFLNIILYVAGVNYDANKRNRYNDERNVESITHSV